MYGFADKNGNVVVENAAKYKLHRGYIELYVLDSQKKADHDQWLEEKRQQALDADNRAMDTFRRRAAVIGFRAGMLCYLLENKRPTRVVSEFATWVAEYVLRNQMELWGNEMEKLLTGAMEQQTDRGAATSLLSLLPKQFTTNDLIQLRVKKNQSVNITTIKSLLFRWKKNGRIDSIGESRWKILV